MKTITLQTHHPNELIDITSIAKEYIRSQKVENGLLVLFVPHTTAAVTINENADPDVVHDMLLGLDRISPILRDFRHMEGNSHAHIKSSLIGVDQHIIINEGKLILGTWQGIYFCEFDGPRSRRIHMTIVNGTHRT